MSPIRIAALVVTAVAVLVAGYLGGWWLREDVVDRSAEIRERTFARQTALQEEVIDLHRDVTELDVQLLDVTPEQEPVLEAHRQAILDRFCDAYVRLTETVTIPESARTLATKECL